MEKEEPVHLDRNNNCTTCVGCRGSPSSYDCTLQSSRKFSSMEAVFLFALLPYCWILGTFFTWLVIKSVEKLLFTHPNALYFAYAVRVSCILNKF